MTRARQPDRAWPPVWSVLRPLGFLLVVSSLFWWPVVLGLVAGGLSDSTVVAVGLTPWLLGGGLAIAVWGSGNVPRRGDYVLDDPMISRRYRKVFSLKARANLFATLTLMAAVGAIVGVILGNAASVILAVDLVVLFGGIFIAMRRSTQDPGRGPRLADRLRND